MIGCLSLQNPPESEMIACLSLQVPPESETTDCLSLQVPPESEMIGCLSLYKSRLYSGNVPTGIIRVQIFPGTGEYEGIGRDLNRETAMEAHSAVQTRFVQRERSPRALFVYKSVREQGI